MARSIHLPPGIDVLVRATGQPQTVTGVESENGLPIGTAEHMVYLDDGTVRSVPVADWPAEQARLAQEEAEREARRQLRLQVLTALDPLTGQSAAAALTLPQAQAFVKGLVFLAGGIDSATGRYRDPREWLK